MTPVHTMRALRDDLGKRALRDLGKRALRDPGLSDVLVEWYTEAARVRTVFLLSEDRNGPEKTTPARIAFPSMAFAVWRGKGDELPPTAMQTYVLAGAFEPDAPCLRNFSRHGDGAGWTCFGRDAAYAIAMREMHPVTAYWMTVFQDTAASMKTRVTRALMASAMMGAAVRSPNQAVADMEGWSVRHDNNLYLRLQ